MIYVLLWHLYELELEAILDESGFWRKTHNNTCIELVAKLITLARLVAQLLFLARADAGQLQIQPQSVSAVAIAQECLARMELAAQKSPTSFRIKGCSFCASSLGRSRIDRTGSLELIR